MVDEADCAVGLAQLEVGLVLLGNDQGLDQILGGCVLLPDILS